MNYQCIKRLNSNILIYKQLQTMHVYKLLTNFYHIIYCQVITKDLQLPVPKANQQPSQEKSRDFKLKKQWKDYKLHYDLIDALCNQGKIQPKWVQAYVLNILDSTNLKKINLFVRASHGSGRILSLLIPILNSIEPILKNMEDECQENTFHFSICKPQGIIIVLTDLLKDRIQDILRQYQQFGNKQTSEKLKFTIGHIDKEMQDHSDLIVSKPQEILNIFKSGKLNLDNCKYIAIYNIDDIFNQYEEVLAEILKISEAHRSNLIACSATMKKQFITFLNNHIKDSIMININDIRPEPFCQKITLKRVKHYYRVATDKYDMHKYVVGTLFKHLYKEAEKKPQVIVFFDSVEQIREFHDHFKAVASDFTSEESAYLANLTVGIIAAKKYQANKKVDMTTAEKVSIMTKYRNNEINILLATNIIARGISQENVGLVISIGPPRDAEKVVDIDFDTYLNRFGRTDRYNQNGIALTLVGKEDLERLVRGLKQIHQVNLLQMKDPEELVYEMWQRVIMNSE